MKGDPQLPKAEKEWRDCWREAGAGGARLGQWRPTFFSPGFLSLVSFHFLVSNFKTNRTNQLTSGAGRVLSVVNGCGLKRRARASRGHGQLREFTGWNHQGQSVPAEQLETPPPSSCSSAFLPGSCSASVELLALHLVEGVNDSRLSTL